MVEHSTQLFSERQASGTKLPENCDHRHVSLLAFRIGICCGCVGVKNKRNEKEWIGQVEKPNSLIVGCYKKNISELLTVLENISSY
jgi:hypothetical protein